MERLILFFVFLALWNVASIEFVAMVAGWKESDRPDVHIIAGAHSGRSGRVVSIPCMANGYNTRMQVNVPGENERREWVYVWIWQTQAVAEALLTRAP